MGRAEQLFSRIQTGGAAEIHNMIAAPVVEELFLDYKRSATVLPNRKLHDDDRKNLSKAIGGFGNSEGGVIVWGVACQQTRAGDIPTGPIHITDPVALKTLIDGAVGGLTLPAHSGVENLALKNTGRADGFVITYVPTGFHVPYQTLYPKEEYYIRAGSSFLPTPHGVLAGLFGRRPQPNVSPIITLRTIETASSRLMRINLDVAASNVGRGYADDIFCLVDMDLSLRVVPSFPPSKDQYESWRTQNDTQNSWTLLLTGLRLPPGAVSQPFSIALDINAGADKDCRLTISFGSSGGPGGAKEIVLPVRLIADAYEHYTYTYPDAASKRAGDTRYEALIKECLGK
jgi:hypothetical protein